MSVQPLSREPSAGPELDTPSSSASKVLGLLTVMLRGGRGSVSLTEVAVAAGLPKSTTHRLLKVLEDHGFVEREGSLYRLGSSFLDLGEEARLSRFADLRDAAYPHLASLFRQAPAIAVHLGVLQGRAVHYVDKLMQPDGVRLPTRVGGRFPAACTGLGKAMLAVSPASVVERVLLEPLPRVTAHSVSRHGQLLAQMQRTRQEGFVVESEEACHGVVCIAAPVLVGDEPVAAVSLAVPSSTFGRSRTARITELGRLVTTSARRISAGLEPTGRGGVPTAGTLRSLRSASQLDSPAPTTSEEQAVVR